ncbi:MAG: Rrf2 family transcriptional regulator [Verrucomicrobiota bacterium]
MELTKFSDYSMRVLIYLGLNRDRLVSISEISDSYDISHNHLTKVVSSLSERGLIRTIRGKGGGIELGKEPASINIGATLRLTENHYNLLECFDPATNTCNIDKCCALKGVLRKALNAFFAELDKYTLADVIKSKSPLRRALGLVRE